VTQLEDLHAEHPQCGQAVALVETLPPHPEHCVIAMPQFCLAVILGDIPRIYCHLTLNQ
jgi:hypothetical protein